MVVGQNGNQIPTGSGYQFSGVTPNNQAKVKNALSDEEIQKLIQKENVFSLAITETEKLRAICTHRYPDGTDALQDMGNGMVRCNICGYEFLPIDINTTPEDIMHSIAEAMDIVQTIKLLFIDMPAPVAREFFQVIALMGKVPELFQHACKDYQRHEGFIPGTYNNRMATIMNLYNMITGGYNVGPQVDQYGNPINPGFAANGMWAKGNPAYNPNAWNINPGQQGDYGFGATGGYTFNPQAGQVPNMGTYWPTNTGYTYDPNQQVAPMNPPQSDQVQTATAQPVTTEGVTEVKQTFKA